MPERTSRTCRLNTRLPSLSNMSGIFINSDLNIQLHETLMDLREKVHVSWTPGNFRTGQTNM